jgi:hypothetical protein
MGMPGERGIMTALATVIVVMVAVPASAEAKIIAGTYPGGIAGIQIGMKRSDVQKVLGRPSRHKFRQPQCPHSATDDYYDSKRLRLHMIFSAGNAYECIPPKYAGYAPLNRLDTRSPAQKTERGIAVGSSQADLLTAYYRGHHGQCRKGQRICTIRTYSGGCDTNDEYVETEFFLQTAAGRTKVTEIRQDLSYCTGY